MTGDKDTKDIAEKEIGVVVIIQGKTLVGFVPAPISPKADGYVTITNAHEVLRFPSQVQSPLGRIQTVLTTVALPPIGLGSKNSIQVPHAGLVCYEVPAKDIRDLIESSRGMSSSTH